MPSSSTRAVLGVLVLCSSACERQDKQPPPSATTTTAPPRETVATVAPALDLVQLDALFKPLPSRFESATNIATPAKIALGRMLYFDPRLSKSQELSCNSCHLLDKGGVDGEQFSKGHKGQRGGRNAPTVFNAAGQIAQFWDGRAADVEEQAKGPVLNPIEMAMPDPLYVLRVLRSIPAYPAAFAKAFPGEKDPITYDNFGRAVGAFERGLVTPTRFDAFLAGQREQLAPAERDGLARFVSTGCAGCHNGPLVGGAMYMKLGLMTPYENTKDQGRFDLTKNEADRMFFKVPSLRNIADTAPYFHDGSIKDLPTAVRTMARLQLGRTLTDVEVESITVFLQALSGKPPAEYTAPPVLPPSGRTTPAPDRT